MKTLTFILLVLFICLSCKKQIKNDQKQDIKINQELVLELKKMFELDQYVSGIPQGKYEGDWQGWFKHRDSVSKQHKIKLESILDEYGYPGYALVGKEVSHNYWNMAQHCDFDVQFQQKVLSKLKEAVKNKDALPADEGFLTDRINVNLGKAQIYGTQMDYDLKTCRVFARNGLIDSINVNQRRKLLNMKSFETYLNEMLEMHFDMNKEHYKKIGILEPKYYNNN